jgi:hypothetical protein
MELHPRKHHQKIRAKNDQIPLEDAFGVTQTYLHSLAVDQQLGITPSVISIDEGQFEPDEKTSADVQNPT